MTVHGDRGYRTGCRCDVCRKGKADRARQYREAGRQRRREYEAATGMRYVVDGITHGIAGYTEHGCRCFPCRLASAQASARWFARQAAARSAR